MSFTSSFTFGKSAQAIIAHLLANPDDSAFDFRPLLHGSMRKNEEQIVLAIEWTITPVQASKIQTCQQHVNHLNQYIGHLEALADSLTIPFKGQLRILESVPGISHVSALVILSEIGPDMTQFKSAKHLTS